MHLQKMHLAPHVSRQGHLIEAMRLSDQLQHPSVQLLVQQRSKDLRVVRNMRFRNPRAVLRPCAQQQQLSVGPLQKNPGLGDRRSSWLSNGKNRETNNSSKNKQTNAHRPQVYPSP